MRTCTCTCICSACSPGQTDRRDGVAPTQVETLKEGLVDHALWSAEPSTPGTPVSNWKSRLSMARTHQLARSTGNVKLTWFFMVFGHEILQVL